jgi:hypothetical protein
MLQQKHNHLTNAIDHVPKKRGRPRKNAIINQPPDTHLINKLLKKYEDDEIILHIPLYDVESSDKSKTVSFDESLKSSDSSSSHDEKNISSEELMIELKKKDLLIKKLKKSLSECHSSYDNATMATKDNKKHYLDLKLFNVENGKPIVVEKTDVVCWWCTYNFDTLPCFIPERYIGGKYYVFGCFCNFSCAYAYNQSLSDYKVSIRACLLNQMYSSIFKIYTPIPIAPPRELLEKFGGELTIEQFRDNSLLVRKEYRINLPPMVPLVPIVDETIHDINPKLK